MMTNVRKLVTVWKFSIASHSKQLSYQPTRTTSAMFNEKPYPMRTQPGAAFAQETGGQVVQVIGQGTCDTLAEAGSDVSLTRHLSCRSRHSIVFGNCYIYS